MAELNARAHGRLVSAAVLLSALVASISFTVVLVARPAAADQVAGLQAEATALSHQLIEEQLQVGAYQQQYSVATARAEADAEAMAQLGRQIGQDQQQIVRKTGAVRQQAVRAYMDYGSGSSESVGSLFSGDQETVQAASEYSGIAAGNITEAVDQLRTAQGTFQSAKVALQHRQAEDLSDQASAASALSQADSTQRQLEASQARVTGQLAVVVAQQARARAAAAQAAVAAAQQAAAHASGSTSAPGPATVATPAPSGPAPVTTSSGGGAGATSDPALPPFLQCVVQAESGGDYGAVSPNGLYMGAFQFSQPTWNTAAQAAGLPGLIGVPPNLASKADQDTLAVVLYSLDGERPWLGDRCS
jgi:peptidoglycan hydrolase CwlO-like protein